MCGIYFQKSSFGYFYHETDADPLATFVNYIGNGGYLLYAFGLWKEENINMLGRELDSSGSSDTPTGVGTSDYVDMTYQVQTRQPKKQKITTTTPSPTSVSEKVIDLIETQKKLC